MISPSSLSAFSVPAPTAARPSAPAQLHEIRSQPPDPAARQAAPALPDARPSLPPPRGSLLNLSV